MNKLAMAVVAAGMSLVVVLAAAGQEEMNMEQTLSDQAQAMTIAFDGIAFLTGSIGADSFLPPGKVADFSGFQYLRDNDPTHLGHNTDFVTIIARNILNILNGAQITQMVERAETQIDLINEYGYMRFPLIKAFRRQLTGDIPAGSSGLDWAAVKKYSADLYNLDGRISLNRAQLFGDILRNMSTNQKSAMDYLGTLGGVSNWNQSLPDPLDSLHLDPDISVGVMTYGSEMYSWYAGSVAADIYFCPERQGTYFGSFYFKDAPAMGNPNYTIAPNLTADEGDKFLAKLTGGQRQLVTNLVTVQKYYLYDLVEARSNVSVCLRQLLVTNAIDTNAVLALCRHYGELDGMIVYAYATHFAQVGQSLSTNQQASLMAQRLDLLGTNLLYPAGAYLYSAPIAMPVIPNTDFLFSQAVTNRLPLEDSGQTSSYTAVFGEDGDYVIDPPAFTTAGSMVTDLVTGRMWQQADGGEMTWEAAQAYAEALTFGGYSDWRLPTAHELYGILNHGRVNPALDTTVFTASAAEYWWSQDRQAGSTNNVWVANAGGGVGPHPKNETISAGGSKRFHVRCVRGAPPPAEAGLRHNFINNADGTITDLDTGLTWQQGETSTVVWTSALQYAESLALAGHSDWRLPNIKELQSINDETRTAPSLDPWFFPCAQATEYWSATTLFNDPGKAWSVDFHYGIASYSAKTTALSVRCVRGGGTNTVVAAGAAPVQAATGFGFTEGPAADAAGNVYFSDVTASIIYRWSLAGELSVVRTNSGGANGLAFAGSGTLLACEGGNGRVTAMDAASNLTVKAGSYNGLRFNEPNDLWVDPAGGVYFTDPVYFGHSVVQGGEYVYYLAPGTTNAVRVATDLVRPNGLVGTSDGQTLYIADWGASNVYRYGVAADGSLTGKTAFAAVRCDGMTLDTAGRVYLCENAVRVFDAGGQEVERISIPERPTNVEFGGSQRQLLFITSDGGSLYSVRMSAQGAAGGSATNSGPVIAAVAHAPMAPLTSDVVWVTARITDEAGMAAAALTYGAGGLAIQTNTVFLETMGTNETKPWNGVGCDQAWTVTTVGASPFEQRIGANYGAGNPCGLEFKLGTTNLADSMVTCATGVAASGRAGSLEFWLWADGLTNNMGWAFQVNAGAGYVTRLSELAGSNHGWQQYRCELTRDELVNGLLFRFQFRGGTGDPRIDLDQVAVKVTAAAGSLAGTVPMLDDGAHGDGAAGDGVYGAQIPAAGAPTTMYYYIVAGDTDGAETYSPTGAPAWAYSYAVGAAPDAPSLIAARIVSDNAIRINWSAAAGATGYQVWRATSNDAGAAIQVGTTTGEYYLDSVPAHQVQYYYWVLACNGAGASALQGAGIQAANPIMTAALLLLLEN